MARATDTFDELYRAHAPAAFRRALRMLGAEGDAHEVVHDVFLSLLERPEQYAGRSRLSSFLYSAVTHACLNRIRNRNTRARLLRDHGASVSFGSAVVAQPDDAAVVRDALARMPEPLAQVAVYYYLDELTHDDIARILGCSRRHVGDLLERLARWSEAEAPRCAP